MNKERQLNEKVIRRETTDRNKIFLHNYVDGDYVRHDDGGDRCGDRCDDGYDDDGGVHAPLCDRHDENWDSLLQI
jgi:hypothetical protein